MIDIDALEALAKAAINGLPGDRIPFALHAMDPEGILALIAEVRALRERNQLAQNVVLYADSVCGMLRGGGWPGKAEALESRIKAVIEFDEAQAKGKV